MNIYIYMNVGNEDKDGQTSIPIVLRCESNLLEHIFLDACDTISSSFHSSRANHSWFAQI